MQKVLFFFGQLSDDDVEWMSRTGTKTHLPAGTVLIREGEESDSVYVVLDGRLSVLPAALNGKEIVRLGAGEIVGEMSFVDSRPPSATVRAKEDSLVLAVSKESLADRLEAVPGFSGRLYKGIAIYLSQQVRRNLKLVGQTGQVDIDVVDRELEDEMDELDMNVLGSIHLAGDRFDRMLKRLLS
jgi:CRP-like cAMP-binding protein